MSTHSFYFKLVNTCQTINYDINLDISISDFINIVKGRARIDFNIDNDNSIEILEAGQFNNINGRDAELAPALEISDTTIREKYGNNYKQISFYIRIGMTQMSNIERLNLENIRNNNNYQSASR